MKSTANRWIGTLNRAPAWKRQVRIGSYTMQVPTLDRWLYAKLHSFRLMGTKERDFLSHNVTAGMRVIDIGANIGLYSMFLAELVGQQGKVYSFEPDPLLFDAACVNARQNGKDNVVTVRNLALGSRAGEAILYRQAFNSGDNRLSSLPGSSETVTVKIARLDDVLGDEKIDFIKMDVQGWEPEVLRGMENILKNNPGLTMYFEFWPEGLRRAHEEVSSPIDILHGYGYSVFFPDHTEPLSAQQIQNLPKGHFGNLVAKR